MHVTRNRDFKSISLSQPGYISTLISRFNKDLFQQSHPTPIQPMTISDMSDPTPITLSQSQQSIYMQIVGSLLFLSTRSRPDIAFAVNYLSLFMQSATQHHLQIGHKLLKYIWHTKYLCLTFNGHHGLTSNIGVTNMLKYPGRGPQIKTWSLKEVKQFQDWCATHNLHNMQIQEAWNLIGSCMEKVAIDYMDSIVGSQRNGENLPATNYEACLSAKLFDA
jgi:hypothetical protein